MSDVFAEMLLKVQSKLDGLITAKKTEQELQSYVFTNIKCYYYYSNE